MYYFANSISNFENNMTTMELGYCRYCGKANSSQRPALPWYRLRLRLLGHTCIVPEPASGILSYAAVASRSEELLSHFAAARIKCASASKILTSIKFLRTQRMMRHSEFLPSIQAKLEEEITSLQNHEYCFDANCSKRRWNRQKMAEAQKSRKDVLDWLRLHPWVRINGPPAPLSDVTVYSPRGHYLSKVPPSQKKQDLLTSIDELLVMLKSYHTTGVHTDEMDAKVTQISTSLSAASACDATLTSSDLPAAASACDDELHEICDLPADPQCILQCTCLFHQFIRIYFDLHAEGLSDHMTWDDTYTFRSEVRNFASTYSFPFPPMTYAQVAACVIPRNWADILLDFLASYPVMTGYPQYYRL